MASTVSSVPGRLFFICTGVVKTSSAPSENATFRDVADELRIQVVQVRFQDRDFFLTSAWPRSRLPPSTRLAHAQAQDIGVPVKVARTRAVANLFRRHLRTRPEAR